MQFTINSAEYYINSEDGAPYFWEANGNEGACHDSLLEAQQDAINHAEAEYNAPSDWLEKQTKLFCKGGAL